VFKRGGRVTAVSGVPGDEKLYYMGSTGGGVWKTEDSGTTWTNISDGFFEAGSIGAVEVSESNPNVIYVGTGSACPRGNVSPGIGMYKSTDAGKTWQHIGLPKAGAIGRIQIHPTNPDVAFVAVLGNLFAPNKERGVYRTRDGGRTWDQVLAVSDRTGSVDVSMDMKNPDVVFAAMWTVERKPWSIDSGGPEGRTVQDDGWRREVAEGRWRVSGERRHRQDRRVGVASRFEPRVRDRGSRRRQGRRVPVGRRRRHLDPDICAPRSAAARVLLHPHLRGPRQRRHGVRLQRGRIQVNRRRQVIQLQ
jgi:hypothetical protein